MQKHNLFWSSPLFAEGVSIFVLIYIKIFIVSKNNVRFYVNKYFMLTSIFNEVVLVAEAGYLL